MMIINKRSIFFLLVLLIGFSRLPLFSQALIPKEAKNGMVVSTQGLASEAGLQILKKGGNAIDAAITTAFVLAVIYPSCGNIGGEGFLLYHGSDGQVAAIDFRLKAPAAVTPGIFLDEAGKDWRKSPVEGLHITDSPLAIGIPGTVAGLAMAHRKYGSRPWAELIDPAVRLAENGFPVSASLHKEMVESREYFLKYPSSTRFFLKNDGTVYETGEIWKQPDLADTLKRIQKNGEAEFYSGKTAELIIAAIRQYGGIMTMEDLKNYRAIERRPDHSTYRNWDVFTMPLPSSGGITETLILNILEGYNLQEMGHNSAQYLHTLTEAMRRAYRDRALYLGDPEFNPDIPKDRLVSKAYAAELRKTIDPRRASKSDELTTIDEQGEKMETTHFSVVDSHGNAVSLTYTLNGDFGAYLVPAGTGVVLNNSLPDFINRVKPGGFGRANLPAAGKRPLSSMTPTIIAKNGKPHWVIGSPGGQTIISTNVQVTVNLIDFGMNIGEAVAAPRIFHGWMPDETLFQKGVTTLDSRKLYEAMGHKVVNFSGLFGPAMCICIDHEKHLLFGAADPRSADGLAASY
jgi:gamma-glutamyltranspeptidase/glutathione hydrolase